MLGTQAGRTGCEVHGRGAEDEAAVARFLVRKQLACAAAGGKSKSEGSLWRRRCAGGAPGRLILDSRHSMGTTATAEGPPTSTRSSSGPAGTAGAAGFAACGSLAAACALPAGSISKPSTPLMPEAYSTARAAAAAWSTSVSAAGTSVEKPSASTASAAQPSTPPKVSEPAVERAKPDRRPAKRTDGVPSPPNITDAALPPPAPPRSRGGTSARVAVGACAPGRRRGRLSAAEREGQRA